jgi:3-oxoacyl-[acyl-carrier-protein] synthase II
VGEGGGAVLLEEYERAKKRGTNIMAEIIGFSCNNNGGNLILPDVEGIKETLRLGLQSARIRTDEVDLISAHATGTKMGDVIEAQAIHSIYGDSPHIVGLKSYMGHTMGTCGVIETVITSYMMEKGFIAPTLNLEEIDKRCAMIRHVTELRESDIRIAAIQNFAFGGVNTCLIIKKV